MLSNLGQFRYDPAEHRYYRGDQELFGVSRLLEAMGLSEGGRWVPQGSYKERGHAVHEAGRMIDLERYTENGTHPKVAAYARGYQQFVNDTGFEPDLRCYDENGGEQPLYLDIGIGGTPDKWGRCGRELWLPDLKSGTTLPKKCAIGCQLGLYDLMIEERWHVRIEKRKGIQLFETGRYKLHDFSGEVWRQHARSLIACWLLNRHEDQEFMRAVYKACELMHQGVLDEAGTHPEVLAYAQKYRGLWLLRRECGMLPRITQ